MRYYGDVYRPPSEARSLIIQAMLGCSNNTCAFCSMYKAKRFQVRPKEDVIADLKECAKELPFVTKIFLADGDALAADTDYLLDILHACYACFPALERVTSYATPQSILQKSEQDQKVLRQAGLTMLYMGLESGSDEVLAMMHKGVTVSEIIEAGQKARRCGFALSVTAITGLGGRRLMKEHGIDTGRALSAIHPEYIGILTLLVEPHTLLERWVSDGSFELLSTAEVLEETRLTVENIDSPGSIFRMNHASNYLTLRGTFNQDRQAMLDKIEAARRNQDMLRPEGWRAL